MMTHPELAPPSGVAALQSESVDRRRPDANIAPPPPRGVPLGPRIALPPSLRGAPLGPRIAAQSAAKEEGEDGGVVRWARPSATSADTMCASVGTCEAILNSIQCCHS